MFKILATWILTATIALFGVLAAEAHASTEDTTEIRAMTEHLNYWYPDLSLSTPYPAQDLSEILSDLQTLENALQGDSSILPGEAKSLACSHPSCGDNSRSGGAPK